MRSAPGREPLAAAAGTVPAGERDYTGLDVLTAAAEDSDELEAQRAHHASNLKNLEALVALAAQCAPEQAPIGSSAAGTLEPLSGLRLAGPQGHRSQSTPPPARLCQEHGIPLHTVAERLSSSHTPQLPDMWMTAGMLVVRGALRLARNGDQFCVWQLRDAMGGHLSMCLFGHACRGRGVGNTWARAEQGDVYFFMTPRLYRGENGTCPKSRASSPLATRARKIWRTGSTAAGSAGPPPSCAWAPLLMQICGRAWSVAHS